MAEAVAALYAAETALEGVALGAFAVSRPTAPLHLSFRKVSSPVKGHEQARSGHTLNIVKGKAYIVGGRVESRVTSSSPVLQEERSPDNNTILALTLPVASSTDGEGDLQPRDYEVITPQFKDTSRPLAQHTGVRSANEGRSRAFLFARIGHTTTTIGDKLYIWGGEGTRKFGCTSNPPAKDLVDRFVVFDPMTKTCDLLNFDASKSHNGRPSPRINHAATASLLPQPDLLRDGSLAGGHGTIFIHGGTSSLEDQTTLRDTWAYDIGTSVWTRLPDIPDPGPSEVANEGRLVYVDGRLWRLGDGFGRAMYLDLAEGTASPDTDYNTWQVISFGTEATDQDATTQAPAPAASTADASSLPIPRLSASVLPITTGSGRQYLLYFMGQGLKTGVLNDFWSFQIQSEEKTASSVKDTIRDAVAQRTKKSWSSGKFSWARCEIKSEISGNDSEGKSEKEKNGDGDSGKSVATWPEGEDLYSFGSDVWTDQGRNTFVMWGGKRADGGHAVDEGWVVTVE